jgi:copper(I)-binding protein
MILYAPKIQRQPAPYKQGAQDFPERYRSRFRCYKKLRRAKARAMNRILSRYLPLAAMCLALTACNPAKNEEAGVEDVWVRLPAVPGRPGAAYFTLRAGDDPLTLNKIESPQVGRIELHETMTAPGGIAHMARMGEVRIPARGTVEFKPGGRHAMLFGIDPAVKAGDKIQIRFRLNPPVEIITEAEVRGAGEEHEGH